MVGKEQCLTEDAKRGYLFIAPTIIGLVVLSVYPFLQTLVLSSSTIHPLGYYEVNGVENYVQMLGGKEFWKATWNSTYFCILTVSPGVFLFLLTVALFNVKIRAKAALRVTYFLPMVVTPAAIAMVWKWILNAKYGIINQVIRSKINWLANPKLVLPARAVATVWSVAGYDAALLLSGIQDISKSYYEAASLDGASKVEQFFKTTLLMVPPTLLVALIMRLMVSLKVYDLIYMMVDQANPALTSAQSLMYLFYRESFVVGNHGYASAIVVWTALLMGAVTVSQSWEQKKWVNYEAQSGGKL